MSEDDVTKLAREIFGSNVGIITIGINGDRTFTLKYVESGDVKVFATTKSLDELWQKLLDYQAARK